MWRGEMKHQIGKLLFMLLPFLIMVVIHVSIPLTFALRTLPLSQDNYNIQNSELQLTTVYSHQQINQKVLASMFSRYYLDYQLLDSVLTSAPQYISTAVNTSNLTLNSALAIAQSVQNGTLSTNYTKDVSMWFATNTTSIANFNVNQLSIYSIYLQVEPFIRAILSDQNSSLNSVDTFIVAEGEQMFFEFPTQYESNYNTSSASVLPDYYYDAMEQYNSNGALITSHLGDQVPDELKLCTVVFLETSTDPVGLSCLSFDLQSLAQQISSTAAFNNDKVTSANSYLMIPNYQNSTSALQVIRFNGSSYNIITNTSDPNYLVSNYSLSGLSSKSHTLIFREGLNTLIFGAVVIVGSSGNNEIPLLLSTQSQYTQTEVASETGYEKNITDFIIAMAFIIVGSSCLTLCILKTTMNSVDDQLAEAEKKSSFIVRGDTQIEIPDYSGSKDIREVYNIMSTLNRLHKYSTGAHFSGHHVDKILKYSQALSFFKKLGYETGNLTENLGGCYFLMGDMDNAIKHLKDSMASVTDKIHAELGDDKDLRQLKRSMKLTKAYKQLEVVLVRRLFTLILAYFHQIEELNEAAECDRDVSKRLSLIQECKESIMLFKKAVSPSFTAYAQSVYVMLLETKLIMESGGGRGECWRSYDVAHKVSEDYIATYPEIGRKLKSKEYKLKLFQMKNKLTTHSRLHPQIIRTLRNYIRALLLLETAPVDVELQRQGEALGWLLQGCKLGVITAKLSSATLTMALQLMKGLEVDIYPLQTTQIYQQIMPKDSKDPKGKGESGRRRLFSNTSASNITSLEREWVLLVDCYQNEDEPYFEQKILQVYDKLIKDRDRLSIIKFNTDTGIVVECNLTLKESKNEILRQEISQCFAQKGPKKITENDLSAAFEKTISRIGHLKNEKVVVLFLQGIQKYTYHQAYLRKKRKSRVKRLDSSSLSILQDSSPSPSPSPTKSGKIEEFNSFGNRMVEAIIERRVKDLKVVVLCSEEDKLEDVRSYFGLEDINSRLWAHWGGLNTQRCTIFVVEKRHRTDLQRIFSRSQQKVTDNHIFIL